MIPVLSLVGKISRGRRPGCPSGTACGCLRQVPCYVTETPWVQLAGEPPELALLEAASGEELPT